MPATAIALSATFAGKTTIAATLDNAGDVGPISVFRDFAVTLAPFAPSFFGKESVAEHSGPRRYVWIPLTDRTKRKPSRVADIPRSLGDCMSYFRVDCCGFGNDPLEGYQDAWRLRQALITYLSQSFGALCDFGDGDYRRTGRTMKGWVIEQHIGFVVPMPEADLRSKPVRDRLWKKYRPSKADFDTSGTPATPPEHLLPDH